MFKDSYILQQISVSSGKSMDQLMEELDCREQYINDMIENGIDNQRDVAEKILSYYTNQREEKDSAREEETIPEVIEELDQDEIPDVHELMELAMEEKKVSQDTHDNWDNVENLLNEIQEEN